MYEVEFTTEAGRRRIVTGFPKLGGALVAAAELLSPGMSSLVRLRDYTVKFRASEPVSDPEWPQPFGPEPAVSVEVLTFDGTDLVFDFNAETGEEARRWAERIIR